MPPEFLLTETGQTVVVAGFLTVLAVAVLAALWSDHKGNKND